MTDRPNLNERPGSEDAIHKLAHMFEYGPAMLSVGSGKIDFQLFHPDVLVEARIANWPEIQPGVLTDGKTGATAEECGHRTELLLESSDALSIFPDKTFDIAVLPAGLTSLDKGEGQKVIDHLLRIARHQVVVLCEPAANRDCGAPASPEGETLWHPEDFDNDWMIVFLPEEGIKPSHGARPFYALKTSPRPGFRYQFTRKTLVIAETALPQGRYERRTEEENALEDVLNRTFKEIDPSSFMISGTWDFRPYPVNPMYDPVLLAGRRHSVQYIYMPGMLNHSQEFIDQQNFRSISNVSDLSPHVVHLAENYYEKIFKPQGIDCIQYIGRPNIAAFCLMYLKEKYGINIRILDYSAANAADGPWYTEHAERFSINSVIASPDVFTENLTSFWDRNRTLMSELPPLEDRSEVAVAVQPAAAVPVTVQVDTAPFPFLKSLQIDPAPDGSQLGLHLTGCKLEIAPAPHSSVRGLQIRGSFKLTGEGMERLKLKAIRILWDSEILSETNYWGSSNGTSFSFSINAGLIGMGQHCELMAVIYLENPEPDAADDELSNTAYFSLGTIKIERILPACRNDDARDQTRLKPLLVSGLGRSGTTLLMKLLLSHSKIAGWGAHPYEGQAAQYWLNAARILLQPRDVRSDVPVTAFQQAMNKIFRNPFLSHPFMAPLAESNPVQEWVDESHVPQTIDFFKLQIDQYYKALARESGKDNAVFFAEKTQPNMHSEVFNEFYGDPAELSLIRHPFDVICSVRSFFKEVDFYKTDGYISALNLGYERMLQRIEMRRQNNKLILYEDMISAPQETMSGVFRFMGLEPMDMPAPKKEDEPGNSHITSGSSESSIHRWKHDLSEADQELAKNVFESTMKRLSTLLPNFDPGYQL